jgi:caffeoyl-CoA O-methyltransferase
VARESFRRAAVEQNVVLHVGAALEKLPAIERQGPFDLVFIDADKENYLNYLRWAERHLRPGGVVLADNAFAWGLLTLPDSAAELQNPSQRRARDAIQAVNTALADPHGPWRGAMVPTGEGLAMGVKRNGH